MQQMISKLLMIFMCLSPVTLDAVVKPVKKVVTKNLSSTPPLIFDHDGNQDDILALLMLLSEKNVDLRGVLVTPGDCEIESALRVSSKVLSLFGRKNVPVVRGEFPKTHNPFPVPWKVLANQMERISDIFLHESTHPGVYSKAAHVWLQDYLESQSRPTDFIITGPVTNLVQVLRTKPELKAKVGKVFWMGGAVDVPGNVEETGHDGSAEWNAYWDPRATADFFTFGLDIYLVPLDATNAVPVTKEFVRSLGGAKSSRVALAAQQIWCQSFFQSGDYHMWDTLTTGLYFCRSLAQWERVRVQGIRSGLQQGRTLRAREGYSAIKVAKQVKVKEFHQYVLKLLQAKNISSA